jgi:hypothetical protein
MTYSVYQGHIAIPATIFAADNPVGVDITRALVNNAQYHIDCQGQVRFKWLATSNTNELKPNAYTSASVADVWYPILQTWIHPLAHPATLGAYKFRVRVGGRSTQGTNAAWFRVAIGDSAEIRSAMFTYSADSASSQPAPWLLDYVTTSSTHTWLNNPDNAHVLTVDESQFGNNIVKVNTLTAIGGDPLQVDSPRLALEVWAATAVASGTTEAAMSGLIVEEWIGL